MYTKDSFSTNSELTKYAKDKYGLDLDGRTPMDKLLSELNEAQNKQPGLQVPDEGISKENQSVSEKESSDEPEATKKIVFGDDPVGKGLALLRKRNRKGE